MEFTHTINGLAVSSEGDFEVIDPATARGFARCPDATREQLDQAVAAARRAFGQWRRTPAAERGEYVRAFAAALRASATRLAPLLTQEQGKPLAAATSEFLRSADHIDVLSTIDIGGELLRSGGRDKVELHYRPLGVVGAITPWNFPVVLAVWKIAHAIYTGNTVVLKPSPYTPLTTLKLGELARGILPPGVLNVLAGGNDLGAWMSEHPGIDKISFTGSGPTGKKVLRSASSSLKRVTLELGGNDAAIVLPDVDIPKAAQDIFWGAFNNSGQICKAIKRIYVHEDIYAPMGNALAAIARATKVGSGMEPGVQLGPVQNRAQFDIVNALIDDARRQGGEFLSGGEPLPLPGYFIPPTIVSGLGKGSRLVEEEPFGPVVPLIRYVSVDDALDQANDTAFGLSGSIWTVDIEQGRALAARLEVGTAWVNQHGGSDPHLPFGGAKASGMGHENALLGLRDYMQLSVVQSPPDPSAPAAK
ncbi:aldehyde dehydrogenase family protein [Parapusillimonas granuli]|nr:aldehyde dehydrogenase family protein [Parapusillimonas granuli]MBB5215608.1 acyl-CoA reductase-like NAD-dependent aldehyde dehydrogenase [Parapusillimonas granuli]